MELNHIILLSLSIFLFLESTIKFDHQNNCVIISRQMLQFNENESVKSTEKCNYDYMEVGNKLHQNIAVLVSLTHEIICMHTCKLSCTYTLAVKIDN